MAERRGYFDEWMQWHDLDAPDLGNSAGGFDLSRSRPPVPEPFVEAFTEPDPTPPHEPVEPTPAPTRPDLNADGTRRDGWWQGGTPMTFVERPPRPKVDPVAALRAWARLLRGVVDDGDQEP